MHRTLPLFLLVWLIAPIFGGTQQLPKIPQVTLHPRVALAPLNLTLGVKIGRHSTNRGLLISLKKDGEEYSSSFIQLDGEDSPAVFTRYYGVTEPGEYVAVVGIGTEVGGKMGITEVRSNVSIIN